MSKCYGIVDGGFALRGFDSIADNNVSMSNGECERRRRRLPRDCQTTRLRRPSRRRRRATNPRLRRMPRRRSRYGICVVVCVCADCADRDANERRQTADSTDLPWIDDRGSRGPHVVSVFPLFLREFLNCIGETLMRERESWRRPNRLCNKRRSRLQSRVRGGE
jgi:hypothetical protein